MTKSFEFGPKRSPVRAICSALDVFFFAKGGSKRDVVTLDRVLQQ